MIKKILQSIQFWRVVHSASALQPPFNNNNSNYSCCDMIPETRPASYMYGFDYGPASDN